VSIISYIACEIEAREAKLRMWAEAYYNGTPMVPDSEFDNEMANHRDDREATPGLFEGETILDLVGSPPAADSGFRKVAHLSPMLSLDNAVTAEDLTSPELVKWHADICAAVGPDTILTIEPKVDGAALRLTYLNGELARAVTRGDGTTGDDVLANVMAANLVPLQLQDQISLEVNGEVFMDFKTFARLNFEQREAGEKEYANPRNAASGAMQLHDPEAVARRGLRFIAHGVLGGGYEDHESALGYLDYCGMEVVPWMTSTAGTEWAVGDLRGLLEERMGDNPYPIDGAVFKVNDYGKRMTLGSTSRAPRWAVALKFLQDKITPELLGITVQVGRTGALTPVAELEPTWVDGSTISRATLHNEDQAARLGIQIGDHVIVAKAGAIIPEVLGSVEHEARRKELTEFHHAKDPKVPHLILKKFVEVSLAMERPPFNLLVHLGGKCPSCGSTDLQKRTLEEATDKKAARESVAWYCMNGASCPAQLPARIQHFCSRKALNIEGIGEEASAAIAASELVKNNQGWHPLDLLEWTPEILAALEWETDSGGFMTFGASRGKKAHAALQRAKTMPLHRWLFALGIRTVGENTSRELSRIWDSPQSLYNNRNGVLSTIARGVKKDDPVLAPLAISSHLGPVSARALLDFMETPAGSLLLNQLATWGIKSDNHAPMPVATGDKTLFGKTFAITGTLSVGRDEIKALIESKGGKVVGSVSSKTGYLVAGEGGGQKADKARAAGVEILDEAALRAML
jgi:DNA ligase (NAD+)